MLTKRDLIPRVREIMYPKGEYDPEWWKLYQVDCDPGESGPWKLEVIEVTVKEAEHDRMMNAIRGDRRHITPGIFRRLLRNNYTIMSDTRDEISDLREPLNRAKGNCLIGGLGLGVVARAMLRYPEVNQVVVIEQSPDVIKLVGTQLKERYGEKLVLVEGDVFNFKPPKGTRFDVAWFDIWDNICEDNLKEMAKLHRRATHYADWYGSWAQAECQAARERWR
jgi:hypothetical protein